MKIFNYSKNLTPADFPEVTKILGKPESMTDEECSPLPVWSDGETCVSCWKLSFAQRINVLIHGKVWLGVLFGATQPPVWLDCGKSVFEYPAKEEQK